MNAPVKYLGHRQLMAKGLACAKSRRRVEQGKFSHALETGSIIRYFILVGALGLLNLIIVTGNLDNPHFERCWMSSLLFVIAIWYLWIDLPNNLLSNSRLSLLLLSFLTQSAMVKFLFYQTSIGSISLALTQMLIPYIFAPLILSVLLGKKEAYFVIIFSTFLNSVMLKYFNAPLICISLASGFLVAVTTQEARQRARIIRAGFYAGIMAWVLGLFSEIIGPIQWSNIKQTDWSLVLLESVIIITANIFIAILISGLLPILENLFQLTTDISWLEMADLNHPLLRRLSLEAPATYQHSMALAHLAEAAAMAIGANSTICRVGAYFHDIGKLIKPEYFVENMSDHQKNPHDDLTPTMSALIITAHIKEGIDLAIKHHLHQKVVDIIRQHHGTTMVGRFYDRARQYCHDARLGSTIINVRPEDIPTIEPENFRYPGPKPQTQEAAIIGLADALESASRSFTQATPQQIHDLAQELLKERLYDHQYDECPITVAELQKVTISLANTFISMNHRRISYRKTDSR